MDSFFVKAQHFSLASQWDIAHFSSKKNKRTILCCFYFAWVVIAAR